uniref:Uncharacterized protein n=1 Tax=Brassica oleracea var. oleracea TaxID=109376 RepID=A0A0D3APB4_BRAOL
MKFYIGDALITQFVFRNRELSGSRRENEVSANILIRNRHKTKYSYWTEVEKIGSIDDLQQLENSVRQSLYQIRAHKIQSEIDVDFGMDNEQQLENFSWVTDENMNVPLKQEDPNMQFYHTYRDITCSASSSLESYSGIFVNLALPKLRFKHHLKLPSKQDLLKKKREKLRCMKKTYLVLFSSRSVTAQTQVINGHKELVKKLDDKTLLKTGTDRAFYLKLSNAFSALDCEADTG